MTSVRNNFEGGPSGTNVTTSNSGQYGDTAFNLAQTGSATLQFADAGSTGLDRPTAEFVLKTETTPSASSSPQVAWTTAMGTQTEIWTRYYVRFTPGSLTASDRAVSAIYSNSLGTYTPRLWLKLSTTTSPKYFILEDRVGFQSVGTVPVVDDVWHRVEIHANATTGGAEFYHYASPNEDGTDYTDAIWLVGSDLGTSFNFYNLRSFVTTTITTPPTYYSNWELNNTGFPGPAPFRAGKGVPGILTNPVAIHTDVS